MLADDRERHLIGHGLINRLAEAHADDLCVGLDVQRTEGRFDEFEVVAPVVRRKGRPVSVEGKGVGGVHDWKGAARLAVAEAERISVARQVVVGQGADPTNFSDQRRLVVVDLHRGMKRMPVCHAHIQHAVALAGRLAAVRHSRARSVCPAATVAAVPARGRASPACGCRVRGDRAGRMGEPAVAFHVDPRQLPFDDLHRDDAGRDVLVRDDRAGGEVAFVDVEQRQGQPEPLEVLGQQRPVLKRGRHLVNLGIREHGVADHVHVMGQTPAPCRAVSAPRSPAGAGRWGGRDSEAV